MDVLNDLPKEELAKDQLNRKAYVQGLALFLRECETPMTVAIQGGWGIGKTSIMNMVRKELKDAENEIEMIEFNPWKISLFHREEQVTLAFLEEMLQLPAEKGSGDRVEHLKKVLSGLIVDASKHYLGDIAGNVVENAMSCEKTSSFFVEMKELREHFARFVKNHEKSRLIFWVDDMDRINPKIAVELLELIKIFFDLEKCIFVVCVDTDIVYTGVKEKYGSALSDDKAKSFFGKIFQLTLQIPTITEEDDIFWDDIFPFRLNTDEREWMKKALYPMTDGVPRELKRFSNALRLRYEIEQKRGIFFGERISSEAVGLNIQYLVLDTLLSMNYPGIYRLYKLHMDFAFLYKYMKCFRKLEHKRWTRKKVKKILGRLEILDERDEDEKLPYLCKLFYHFFERYSNSSVGGYEWAYSFAGLERAVFLVRGEAYRCMPKHDGANGLFAWMDSILSAPFRRVDEGENPLFCGKLYDYYSDCEHIAEERWFFQLCLTQDPFDPESDWQVEVRVNKAWLADMPEQNAESWLEGLKKNWTACLSDRGIQTEVEETGDYEWCDDEFYVSFGIVHDGVARVVMSYLYDVRDIGSQ